MARKGVSLQYVADNCDRSVTTVRRWMSGRQTPNTILLKRLGKLLADDVTYFTKQDVQFSSNPP